VIIPIAAENGNIGDALVERVGKGELDFSVTFNLKSGFILDDEVKIRLIRDLKIIARNSENTSGE
jgi:hypothetical protein